MDRELNEQEKLLIQEGIKKKYIAVAQSPNGRFNYPTGEEGIKKQGYPSDIISDFPDPILESFCGVGNPFSLGSINKGEVVLDIGCGAGFDSLVAAKMTGPQGEVIGIDITAEMIKRAKKHSALLGLANVRFEVGKAETLTFKSQMFDVVISNGVFNLTLDKEKALKETFRALKPAGRLMIADMVLVEALPSERAGRIENWYQ